MVGDASLSAADRALAALLRRLDALDYEFVTPTPTTHDRVVAREGMKRAGDLRGVFGWSLPFPPALLPDDLTALLAAGGALSFEGELCRSAVRVSRLAGLLFLHGAYPTDQADSVFLGPDSYRFAAFVTALIGAANRIVDMGAGAGVGGIVAGRLRPEAAIVMVDCNPEALRFARINADAAGVAVETVAGDTLDAVIGAVDLVIANPPFMLDEGGPAYRDGGPMLGARRSLDWAMAAARRLAPGGRMLLYTGSAIVAGRDALREALEEALPAFGCSLNYAELDPDIFGEQLDLPVYRSVERIAAVGAVIRRAD